MTGDPAVSQSHEASTRALSDLVANERLRNLHRINLLRFSGVAAFFALFACLGGLLRDPGWTGHLRTLSLYFSASTLILVVERLLPRVRRYTAFFIAAFDLPTVFLVQWSSFPQSDPSGTAGFTLGIYVLFIGLTTVALSRAEVVAAAVVATGLEVELQRLAGVDFGGQISSAIVLSVTASACLYAQFRLRSLLRTASEEARQREEIQSRMAHADRLASIGELSAGIAHDVNNPLGYVLSNLTYFDELSQRMAKGETLSPEERAEFRESVASAREGAEVVRRLARDLTTLSRAGVTEYRPVEIDRIVTTAINVARYRIRGRAQLITELKPVPLFFGDGARLGQVFVNLLVNAAQAIPEGQPEAHSVTVGCGTDDVGRTVIEVRDTGAGMSEDVKARIFEPFFTTKPVGEGTGLGLSLCREIIEAHHGRIEVTSELGHGTTFRVLLPLAEAETANQDPSP